MVVVCGQVVGPDGKPACGVEVELVDAHGARLATATTDATGQFNIEWRAKAGVYAVRASHFGCITASIPFHIQQTPHNLLLRIGTSKQQRSVVLQNGIRVDLGDLLLKSYKHAVVVTGIGLLGVFLILAVLIGVVRVANAFIRRLS
ncbi:MAG: hypothetical protein DRP63_02520 [Planctomycetota bacterium]|nr:MAG: hypothetical protein DRP63_02520 [Planctomycetota bacterium]